MVVAHQAGPDVAAGSEHLYRTLVEHANDGIAVVQDARFVYANPSIAALAGRRSDEMIGLHIAEVFHPGDLPTVLARHEARVRGEPVESRYEIRIRRPNGELRWGGFSVVAMLWNGRPASLGVVTDITARKDLEDRLQRALAERETILQSALVGISLAVDREHRWVNRKLEELLGWGPGELVGQSSRVEFHDDAAWRAFGELAYTQIAAGTSYRGEVRLRRKDGSPIWLEVCGSAIEPGNLAKGTIWTYLDIRERREAEAATLAALEQQRHMNELLARFVSMTSHEFRTPLAAIFSSAEILRCYATQLSEDDQEELYDSIEAGVRRMTVMLDNVLEFGRAQTGRLEFSPTVLDLHAVCEQIVAELVRAQATHDGGPREIDFVWEIEEREACIDEHLLRQILGNLLSNAIKYSPDGGRVALEVRRCDAGLCFDVRDEGIGIPSEDLPRLFSTFHRARNVGAIAGTGLGLAIVKRAVEGHGGTIHVDTAAGHGTVFSVTLPVPGA
jgi:PAS domain S-box-containing protein